MKTLKKGIVCAILFSFAHIAFAANVSITDTNAVFVLPSDNSTYSLSTDSSFDSLTINNTDFVFIIPSGATVSITSRDSDRALDNTLDVSTTCGSGESTLSLTNNTGSQESVTITPGSTCVTSNTTTTSSSSAAPSHFYGQSSHSSASAVQTTVTVTTTNTPVLQNQIQSVNSIPAKNNSAQSSGNVSSDSGKSAGNAPNISSSQNQNTAVATSSPSTPAKKSVLQSIAQSVIGGFRAVFHSVRTFFSSIFSLF